MDNLLVELSNTEFSKALSSKAAVPGGGGASALVGALGAALGLMVGNLTVGKAKYADSEPQILKLMDEAEQLRLRLLELVDGDAEAFEPLSKAYSIPKDAPNRDEIMEKCLKDAAAVPMEILRISCKVIELQQGFAELGSTLAISDAGTGVAFCQSAMKGAALNVLINTRSMKDRAYAEEMNFEVETLLNKYEPMAQKVYKEVYERLS